MISVRRLSGIDEFLGRDLDVAGNLPQQDRGNVTALMKRNRRAAAVRVTELLVRPFLSNLSKAERNESRHDFRRLENRQLAFRHCLAHLNRLGSDELGFQGRLAILEQHLDDFGQIPIQFFDRFALGMRTGKAGNISNVEARVGAPLDDGRVGSHTKFSAAFLINFYPIRFDRRKLAIPRPLRPHAASCEVPRASDFASPSPKKGLFPEENAGCSRSYSGSFVGTGRHAMAPGGNPSMGIAQSCLMLHLCAKTMSLIVVR
jgi:hypothetical protein